MLLTIWHPFVPDPVQGSGRLLPIAVLSPRQRLLVLDAGHWAEWASSLTSCVYSLPLLYF